MISKKDYNLIAIVIKDILQRKAKGDRIVELFSDAFQKNYKNFNSQKFNEFIKK